MGGSVATIIDIAKRAGVSVATVSRSFSHPDKLRPATRDKVNQAIAELDYCPNAMARSLRQMRSKTVIVIVPQIQHTFFSGIVQGIENIAHDNGFKVLLGETQERQERLDYYATMVSSRIADGLILLGPLLPSEVTARSKGGMGQNLPLVLVCERFEDIDCPQVAIDNEQAAYEAVRHLTEQGCRRVATISGPLNNGLSQDRVAGYRRALASAGLPDEPELIIEGSFAVGSGYSAMQRLLAFDRRPDGIFCANDEMAIGALHAIRQAGYSVPDDFAIVGFDDLRFSEFVDPPLSTIRQPTWAIGEAAMRLMIQLLDNEPITNPEIILGHELVLRESSIRKP